MLNRKQKKEIRQVIKKYVGNPTLKEVLQVHGLLFLPVVSVGIIVDLAVTGGLGTTSLLFLGTAGGMSSFSTPLMIAAMQSKETFENAAHQTISTKQPVRLALNEMDKKLKTAFNEAVQKEASPQKTKDFFLVAQETLIDLQKLSPAFEITSGGDFGFGTKEYEFILAKAAIAPGQQKLISLSEILRSAKQNKHEKKIKKPKGGFQL